MTEEEKETIAILEDLAEHGLCYTVTEDIQGKLKIILNLIQKQQEEIEKKDEQINELEDKLSLIEEYYDISDLEQIIKEDMWGVAYEHNRKETTEEN